MDLDPSTNLYTKRDFKDIVFKDGQIISSPLLSSMRMGKIVDLMINRTLEKNEKFENYKKFDENILAIVNFSCESEEYREFEERVKELEGINFDKIIIVSDLFDVGIREINLN